MATAKGRTKAGAPRKRAPGAGRKKSSPMRQHLAGMQACRRSDPKVPIAANAPLAGKPPSDLGQHGKFLWTLLVEQQADAAEKGIEPQVGMESHALAHAYCSAFDRWSEVKQTIASRERALPAAQRHEAKWIHDEETGDTQLNGIWVAEMKFRSEAIKAAKALGLGGSHPATALQVNINGQQVAADPALSLVGPYRASGQIVDAVAEPG